MIFFCVLAALAGGACDPVLIKTSQENDDHLTTYPADSVLVGGSPDGEGSTAPKSQYVTGVEYPEGVDWQKDIGYDLGGTLFLMKDGEKIVELPVGYNECVAIDADMHRCIDGHLYTDFSTDDNETVVKVDGKEAFRYSGREMIKSMCVHDDVIYTLSVPRDGSETWAYRRDGVLQHSNTGDLIGGLYVDNSEVIFTYKLGDTYYMCVSGTIYTVTFNSYVYKAFDVRRIDGVVNYISTDGSDIFAMEDNVKIATIGMYATNYEIGLGIYYDGKGRFYAGRISNTAVMNRESAVYVQKTGSFAGLCLSGDDYIYVLKNSSNETETICCNGEDFPWPDGTELMYDTCIGTDGTDYTIALINRSEGNAPALWKNGSVTNYDFNGVFTHVDYW